jgi:hypothetical protein
MAEGALFVAEDVAVRLRYEHDVARSGCVEGMVVSGREIGVRFPLPLAFAVADCLALALALAFAVRERRAITEKGHGGGGLGLWWSSAFLGRSWSEGG